MSATINNSELVGVGIDTARYGHHATILNAEREVVSPPMHFAESAEGYEKLDRRLRRIFKRKPTAHFRVHIDAAGQYATNLIKHLSSSNLPMTVSVGEPKRNKDYHNAMSPKRKSDETESLAMARFAVSEKPTPTPAVPDEIYALREIASRLESQVKTKTQAINRFHNLLARVFPELAAMVPSVAAQWLLALLKKYPTPKRIARASLKSLEGIPYIRKERAEKIQEAARASVGSFKGDSAEKLVRQGIEEIHQAEQNQKKLETLLTEALAALPEGGHTQVSTIAGIGEITAAVLVAKMISIDRFETAEDLVGYFGIFPQEHSSGVDRDGVPHRRRRSMSKKGNDLARRYLFCAAKSAITHNPAVKALYARLRARGTRGDVALGHCMRKLLHLVFAIWRKNEAFDKNHFPWEHPDAKPVEASTEPAADQSPQNPPAQESAAGLKQDIILARKEVTAAASTVASAPTTVKSEDSPKASSQPPSSSRTLGSGSIDYAYLRSQFSIGTILEKMDHLDVLRGQTQLRGPCPFHESASGNKTSFSVNLEKNTFRCCSTRCEKQGNALDLWVAYTGLPLYEAALKLAADLHLELTRKREESTRKTEPQL